MSIGLENRDQLRSEGCSIIRTRPNGFLVTFDISLDMDHLLLSSLPAASMEKNNRIAKNKIT